MRRIRWKPKYLTGELSADERNKSLVAILNGLYEELRAKEHCQDMEELYGELAQLTDKRLASREAAAAAADDTVRNLLRTSLPLEALGSPACRECDLCDVTEEQLTGWLRQNKEMRRPGEAVAA